MLQSVLHTFYASPWPTIGMGFLIAGIIALNLATPREPLSWLDRQ